MRRVKFSEIEQIPWVAVGGLVIPDLICGELELKSGHRILLYMSMEAQRILNPIIPHPRFDGDTGMMLHELFDALVAREGDKPWKKELKRTLKQKADWGPFLKAVENGGLDDLYLEEDEFDEVDLPKRTKRKQKKRKKKNLNSSNLSDEDFADTILERQLVEIIDVQGAAEIHEVSEATIRKWLNEDELEGYKDGSRWLIPVYSGEELSVKEASEIFGASPAKIREWLSKDLIAGYKNKQNRWCVYAPDE